MDLTDNLHDDLSNLKNHIRTKEGLPRITQETLDTFNKEIKRKINSGCLEPLLEEWCKQLESENTLVLNEIQYFVNYYHPDSQGVTLLRFVMLYNLLKTQAINDNLSISQKIFEYFSKPVD